MTGVLIKKKKRKFGYREGRRHEETGKRPSTSQGMPEAPEARREA